MPVRIAFIGAGSVGFTRTLFRDVLTVPELADTEFTFHDISQRNLDMVTQLCRKDLEANAVGASIHSTLDRREALEGAHYIINCTRIGGLEAFQLDIDIPLKYGIDQCVGDTLCAGGLMYAQRNIPVILEFCRDIREVAADDALFLNYANPMAMNVWAALDAGGPSRGASGGASGGTSGGASGGASGGTSGGVRTIGLCHGVQHGHRQIAEVLGAAGPHEVDIIAAGINHQTWYIRIRYKGRLIGGEELLEAFEQHETYRRTEKVRIDVLRRFGCYSTESNGHLSEYLPWYRKRPDDIQRWIDTSDWIHGETGGYLRVCAEGRNGFETDFPRWLQEAGEPFDPARRSDEHGSYIIEALETGRAYRGHFNVRNHSAISNLPDDCIVEVPGYVDANGVSIPRVGELPLACAATCQASIDVQRMGVKAALEGDVTLLKQAMLHDPLVGAVCDPEEVWQMVDELLVAQAPWLPQYAGAIEAAKRRLAAGKVPTRQWSGAARQPVRNPEQLRREREKAGA